MTEITWPTVWMAVSISATLLGVVFFTLRADIRENRQLIIKYIAQEKD